MKTNKSTPVSTDEKMLIWTAYRYCIGRKTYVNSLAQYIGKTYYDRLSDDEMESTAEDIRNEILRVMNFGSLSFTYDYSVPMEKRNPLQDFIEWINNNVTSEDDFLNISQIQCYYEKGEKLYNVHKMNKTTPRNVLFYPHDLTDLFYWERLASLFDKKNYYKVTTNYNGTESTHICFMAPTTAKKVVQYEGEIGVYQDIPWKFENIYITIDSYLKYGDYSPYIANEYITKVEKVC